MAIPGSLTFRTGDVSLTFAESGGVRVGLGFEVYHDGLGDTLHRGTLWREAGLIAKAEDTAGKLYDEAVGAFNSYVERHKPINAIGGLSAHDADLVLDGWWYDPSGESYDLNHPICGHFAGVSLNIASFVSMVNAIIDRVPEPPVWAWAEPYGAGQLRVRCVSVPGADSYNVYNGDELLDNVPSAAWNTISVPAGPYFVKVAAVQGAQVGILSFGIGVEVE